MTRVTPLTHEVLTGIDACLNKTLAEWNQYFRLTAIRLRDLILVFSRLCRKRYEGRGRPPE